MTWTIERRDPDGTVQVVACVGDQLKIGTAIDEDRKTIDWEPEYRVRAEK